MNFVGKSELLEFFRGKTVAVVGSGPGSLNNPPGLVDSHDIVVRVNEYGLFPGTGYRTDVFYSYFGSVIHKTVAELKRDGVKLCMAKCPNAKFMDSPWHEANRKPEGVDFRYIYERRKAWWFCDTYIPDVDEFLLGFELLEKHVPTSGFAAIFDVLKYEPKHVFLTGFDFFQSGRHNVTEVWKPGDAQDPIGHRPDLERQWIKKHKDTLPLSMDSAMRVALDRECPPPQAATPRRRVMGRRR